MNNKSQEVLGVDVDTLNKSQVLEVIEKWIETGGFHYVVTVYSEFLVKAGEDSDFKKVLNKADLAVVDGAAVLAAVEFLKRGADAGYIKKLSEGIRVGWRGLRGKNGETVTGVWLSSKLVEEAAVNGWKVYLLGGYGDRAGELAEKFKRKYPGLQIKANKGEQRVGKDKEVNREVLEEIDEFKPDILLVAYGPVKQEKWIWENKDRLAVKVAIGVGGTFDELTGKVKKVPAWLEKRGLKSFWRVIQEPSRINRMIRAWFVFPWKVFLES